MPGKKKLLSILREGADSWNEWRLQHLGKDIDLAGADLSEVDLRGADLKEADLKEADLSRALLSRARLREASLFRADLSGALLLETDLSEADLKEADLSGADLSGSDLTRANLMGANLAEANLSKVRLAEANLLQANLSRTNLVGADLSGADLSGARLTEADLSNGVTLTDADLRTHSFDVLRTLLLEGAPVLEANLDGAVRRRLKSEPIEVEATAWIYLPEKGQHLDRDRLLNAVGGFMEALGFELKQDEEPVTGSWLKKLNFKLKELLTSEEAGDELQKTYSDAYEATKARAEGITAHEKAAELSGAASELIASLDDVKEATLRVGNLLVIKQTIDGDSCIDVRTVSPATMRELERKELSARDPGKVKQFLRERKKGPSQIEDASEGELPSEDEPKSESPQSVEASPSEPTEE